MTLAQAKLNIEKYYEIKTPNDDEDFLYIESLEYMIKETNDPSYMMELGGYYYEKQNFDLALKYYEIAALKDYTPAYECLGYIWYYGRLGKRDYKKAFEYFEKASKNNDIIATYKLADMYKNGYGVEKDYDKYKNIIKELYDELGKPKNYDEPYPEIYTRLAKIYMEEGKNEEAEKILLFSKDFLATRITFNAFFGNFTIMKYLIYDLYKIRAIDIKNFDLYDLYEILKNEHTVSIKYKKVSHTIESISEDGGIVIKFDNNWYKTFDDFIMNALIDDIQIVKLYDELYDYKLIK